MTVDFRNFLTQDVFLDLFRRHEDVNQARRAGLSAKYAEVFRLERDLVDPIIAQFLIAKRDRGQLLPFDANTLKYRARFATCWNDFVSGDIAETPHMIVREFWSFAPFRNSRSLQKEDQLSWFDLYQRSVDNFTQGNFRWNDPYQSFHSPNIVSELTGKYLTLEMKSWRPMLGIQPDDYRSADLVPLPVLKNVDAPVVLDGVFETGDLLISDFVRAKGFNDIFDEKLDVIVEFDLNCKTGRDAATKTCLEKFGLITVVTTDSSPHVFEKDGNIVMGRLPERMPYDTRELDGFSVSKDMIVTDVHGIAIIEKQKAISILAEKLGDEAARKTIADWLADDHGNVTELKVQPGPFRLIYQDYQLDPKKLKSRLKRDGLNIGRIENPLLAVLR